MMSAKNGCSTGVLAAGISDTGRTGGRVLPQHAGLLIDPRAVVPSNSGVMSSIGASTMGCMTVVSAVIIEHMGPAQELTVVERSQGRSLTELA